MKIIKKQIVIAKALLAIESSSFHSSSYLENLKIKTDFL
jgi:hypothetical protein